MVDVTTATILKSEETRQVRARKFQMVACVSFLGKDNMKLDFIVRISLQNGQSWVVRGEVNPGNVLML